MKNILLSDAMNTYNPALEVILNKGYEINIIDYDDSFDWCASKDKNEFIASDPLRLLALINIYEIKGNNWNLTKKNYYDIILDGHYNKDE